MQVDRPVVISFVGIPGSGKTTFAKRLALELPAVVLSSDSMRLAMWQSLEAIAELHTSKQRMIEANRMLFGGLNYVTGQILKAGMSVAFDANASHRHERQEKHDLAAENGALSVVVRMKVPYDLSLQRIQTREATHDARKISPEDSVKVLERFSNELEEPGEDENTILINGEMPFEAQYEEFQRAIARFNQTITGVE